MRTRSVLQLLAYCGMAACASSGETAGEDSKPDRNAVIIQGPDLAGDILASIQTRIPSTQITNQSGCPRITFRGQRSRVQGNPGIYIDGTRMADTCALNAVSTNDIDYVEVYPGGNTSRSGIQRNPFGLILIFRRHQ